MKKLISFLLILFLVSLTFSSCDVEGLIDIFDQSDKGEKVAMEYDYEQMQANLSRIKEENGILVEMNVVTTSTEDGTETATVIYAEDNDAFYYSSEEIEIIFDFSNEEKCVTYEKDEDGVWVKLDTVYAETNTTREEMMEMARLYSAAFMGYLGNYEQFSGEMMAVKEERIANRLCDTFTYSLMLGGYGFEYVFSVDQETGMCLKWEFSAAAGAEGSAGVEYVCTRFETPYDITIPSDAIDVTPPKDEGSQS